MTPAPSPSTPATLNLPLELLNDGAANLRVKAVLNLNASDLASASYLAFTCHRCNFFGAPEWERTTVTPPMVKASVRVLGTKPDTATDVPWIDITDKTVEMPPAERLQGGLSVSGLYTVRIKIPLDAATRARLTSAVSGNTIEFRFNGTDGESNGYRVIKLDLQNASGRGLSTNAVKMADIGQEKAKFDPALVAAGRTLWSQGNGKLAKSTIVSRQLKASCASCHGDNARDLQYFNYSDKAIVQRGLFHRLTADEANKVLAYVRANEAKVTHVAQAAPWNPPYQPGPGMDSKPITHWAAGAGLDMVLDTPQQTLNALQGADPFGPRVPATQASVDKLMNGKATMNTREIAVALQFPDWNAWLPAISPEDVWPDGGAQGSFNSGAVFNGNGNTNRYDPKGAMKRLDDKLKDLRGNRAWGDWSHMNSVSSRERKFLYGDMQDLGWQAARFVGGGRSFKIAETGKHGGQVGADYLMSFRDATSAARNPAGTSYNSFVERAYLSMLQWETVQQWNLVQKYGLEGDQSYFIGAPGTAYPHDKEAFRGIGEKRGWALQTPGAFHVAPHMGYTQTFKPDNMVFQWEDNANPIGSRYRSHIWYYLQMVLNPGAAQIYSNYPMDWPYHTLYAGYVSGGVIDQKDKDARQLGIAHLLREIQIKTKYAQEGKEQSPQAKAGATTQINPGFWLLPRAANQVSRFAALNDLQPDLYRMFVSGSFKLFNEALGDASTIPVSAWRRCDPNLIVGPRMEIYNVGAPARHCVDPERAIVKKNASGAYELTHSDYYNTTGETVLYAALVGSQLNADASQLATYNSWVQKMWPNPAKSADMEASIAAPSTARVGQAYTATATCRNLGAQGLSNLSDAVQAVCRVSGVPDSATRVSTTCATSPRALMPAGTTVTCQTTFTPTVAQSLTLRAEANSWSFDPAPLNGRAAQVVAVN